MDDFALFTDQDRQDLAYRFCIGGFVATGAAVGRLGMLPGLLAGAVTGLAFGLLSCKRLSPAIERKLFSAQERLTEPELLQVLRVIRDQTGARSKVDTMYLLSHARRELTLKGERIKNEGSSCLPARIAAHQILTYRT